MPDLTFGQQLAMQMAQQATGGIMGLALGDINDKRQLKQQEKLQNLQITGQKQMTDYNYGKQLEMWKATSYQAQIEQMKLAGLNPALLYGMSGGGGQTVGSGSGGNVSGGQAPTGGGEVQAMMGMGIQSGLLEAQRRVLETQADKNTAEADKTRGVDTALGKTQIQALTAGTEKTKAEQGMIDIQTSILEVEQHIKGSTQNAAIALILYEMRESYERMGIMINENKISSETVKQKVEIVKAELLGIYLKNALTEAQTGKTKSDITVNEAQISKMAQDILQGWSGLDRQERELKLKTWEAQMKIEYPTIWQSLGNGVKRIVDTFDKIEKDMFGGNVFPKNENKAPHTNKN